jgi:hypothetical protein
MVGCFLKTSYRKLLEISTELFLFTNTWYCPFPYFISKIERVMVTERFFCLTVTWQPRYRLRILSDSEILQTASTKPRTDNLRMRGKEAKKVGVVKSVPVWMYSETMRKHQSHTQLQLEQWKREIHGAQTVFAQVVQTDSFCLSMHKFQTPLLESLHTFRHCAISATI